MIKMQYKADKAWACGEERAQISQLASWKPVDWWILLQPNIKHNSVCQQAGHGSAKELLGW